jgi:predicted nucleic acid-binding Zn ribbon protein
MPTQQQLNKAKKATSFAWAKYYEKIREAHTSDVAHYNTIQKIKEEVPELPTHLVTEYQQMLNDLHKQIECPICMQVITELKITGCGHKYCAECFKRIDKCAICRKKIRK